MQRFCRWCRSRCRQACFIPEFDGDLKGWDGHAPGISTSALSRSSGLKKANEKSMKTLTTIAVIAFLLMPSIAEACSDHKRKPVKCSGYTNINGTTKSTCR